MLLQDLSEHFCQYIGVLLLMDVQVHDSLVSAQMYFCQYIGVDCLDIFEGGSSLVSVQICQYIS